MSDAEEREQGEKESHCAAEREALAPDELRKSPEQESTKKSHWAVAREALARGEIRRIKIRAPSCRIVDAKIVWVPPPDSRSSHSQSDEPEEEVVYIPPKKVTLFDWYKTIQDLNEQEDKVVMEKSQEAMEKSKEVHRKVKDHHKSKDEMSSEAEKATNITAPDGTAQAISAETTPTIDASEAKNKGPLLHLPELPAIASQSAADEPIQERSSVAPKPKAANSKKRRIASKYESKQKIATWWDPVSAHKLDFKRKLNIRGQLDKAIELLNVNPEVKINSTVEFISNIRAEIFTNSRALMKRRVFQMYEAACATPEDPLLLIANKIKTRFGLNVTKSLQQIVPLIKKSEEVFEEATNSIGNSKEYRVFCRILEIEDEESTQELCHESVDIHSIMEDARDAQTLIKEILSPMQDPGSWDGATENCLDWIDTFIDPSVKSEEKVLARADTRRCTCAEVLDISRVALVFDDFSNMLSALKEIKNTFTVLELENSFAKPACLGWRAIAVRIENRLFTGDSFRKHVSEIQLQHRKYRNVQEKAHTIYEEIRQELLKLTPMRTKSFESMVELIMDLLCNYRFPEPGALLAAMEKKQREINRLYTTFEFEIASLAELADTIKTVSTNLGQLYMDAWTLDLESMQEIKKIVEDLKSTHQKITDHLTHIYEAKLNMEKEIEPMIRREKKRERSYGGCEKPEASIKSEKVEASRKSDRKSEKAEASRKSKKTEASRKSDRKSEKVEASRKSKKAEASRKSDRKSEKAEASKNSERGRSPDNPQEKTTEEGGESAQVPTGEVETDKCLSRTDGFVDAGAHRHQDHHDNPERRWRKFVRIRDRNSNEWLRKCSTFRRNLLWRENQRLGEKPTERDRSIEDFFWSGEKSRVQSMFSSSFSLTSSPSASTSKKWRRRWIRGELRAPLYFPPSTFYGFPRAPEDPQQRSTAPAPKTISWDFSTPSSEFPFTSGLLGDDKEGYDDDEGKRDENTPVFGSNPIRKSYLSDMFYKTTDLKDRFTGSKPKKKIK